MEQIYSGSTGTFSFLEVETKGEKEYYISGYISTKAIDTFNDLVTDECMSDMLEQINSGSIKIDFEHETIHNENLDINPVARIVEAKKDEKGIWVKAMINSANKRFSEMWGSIKNGFLDSFSIAFKPIETATRYIQGKAVRLLNKLKLVNIGLTGTPVNSECKLDNIIVKAISEMESEINLDDLSDEELESLEIKGHKYIKRTGSSGNYTYYYRDGSSSKRQKGESEKPKESESSPKMDKKVNENIEGAFDKATFDSPEDALKYYEYIVKNSPIENESEKEYYKRTIEGIKKRIESQKPAESSSGKGDTKEDETARKNDLFRQTSKERNNKEEKKILMTPKGEGSEEEQKLIIFNLNNIKEGKTYKNFDDAIDNLIDSLDEYKQLDTELIKFNLNNIKEGKVSKKELDNLINSIKKGKLNKTEKKEIEKPKVSNFSDKVRTPDGKIGEMWGYVSNEKHPEYGKYKVYMGGERVPENYKYFKEEELEEVTTSAPVPKKIFKDRFGMKSLEKKALSTTPISHSTEQSDDNKQMAEEENQVANEANEVKTLETSETEEVKTDNANLEKELEETNKELAEVKAKMVELEKQLAKPEFKALQDTPITKLKENNVTPLGLIG